ncbi:MAG: phenylalanine--tRNA ligase subunit beta, partial [Gammaproteobacteria bacterium]
AEDRLPVLSPIRLRAARLALLLGIDVPPEEVAGILGRLGLGVEAMDGGWQVTPTSFRFDIRMEAALAEEVARVWGYERIPLRVQPAAERLRPTEESSRSLPDLRRRLCALGYQEAITYSFVSPAMQSLLDPGSATCPVANPISSDMAVMRSSLWAGLLTALQHNQNRQQRRVRLFETGLRFLSVPAGDVPAERSPIPTLDQRMAIAGIACGSRQPENWTGDGGALDFFDIKGDVEALLDSGDGRAAGWVFEPAEHPALHPGQCARLRRGEQLGGFVGALHPRILAALDITGPVYLFELDLAEIRRKTLPSFKGLSRFPEVRRDMALVLDEAVPAELVLSVAREAAGKWLKNLTLFDVYRGQGIELNKKSVAIGIVLQHPERTLTDAEVGAVVEGIVAALAARCAALQRY